MLLLLLLPEDVAELLQRKKMATEFRWGYHDYLMHRRRLWTLPMIGSRRRYGRLSSRWSYRCPCCFMQMHRLRSIKG